VIRRPGTSRPGKGLADRTEQLNLSRHSQYVKRIYRKLGVDSRVALTRLLLSAAGLAHVQLGVHMRAAAAD
jgi:hypothetical protein